MYYKPLPIQVTINNSEIDGLGLFATQDIPEGHDFGMTHIHDTRFPDEYIRLPLGGFFNHSSTPNTKIVESQYDENIGEVKHLRLISIKEIKKGEEIVCYYTLYDPTK
jgi:SET domain-containing protein